MSLYLVYYSRIYLRCTQQIWGMSQNSYIYHLQATRSVRWFISLLTCVAHSKTSWCWLCHVISLAVTAKFGDVFSHFFDFFFVFWHSSNKRMWLEELNHFKLVLRELNRLKRVLSADQSRCECALLLWEDIFSSRLDENAADHRDLFSELRNSSASCFWLPEKKKKKLQPSLLQCLAIHRRSCLSLETCQTKTGAV